MKKLFIISAFLFFSFAFFDTAYALPGHFPPTLTTNGSTVVNSASVNLLGEITFDGSSVTLERGFEYGLTTSYGSSVVQSSGPYIPEPFSINVTSLACGTTYHFRAFATNSTDTGYGNDASFTTNTCAHYTSGRNTPPSSNNLPPTTVTPPGAVVPVETICNPGDNFSSQTGFPCTSYRTNPSTINSNRILRLKVARGDDIKALQVYLNTHGYPLASSGPGSLHNETTKFGLLTYASVMKFQAANHLAVDGVVGPKTLAIINNNI